MTGVLGCADLGFLFSLILVPIVFMGLCGIDLNEQVVPAKNLSKRL